MLFLTDSEGLTFHGSNPNFGFGVTLDRYFRSIPGNSAQQKFEVHTALVGGSNAYTWLMKVYDNPFQMVTYDENGTKHQLQASKDYTIPVPGIDEQVKLCKNHEPKVLVIEAGANMFGDGDDEHKGRNLLVPELLKKIQSYGFKCIWVGPPRVGVKALAPEKYDRINAKLRHMIDRPGGCLYVSSADKMDPANLGAANQNEYHYDPIYGTQWAKKVIPEVDPVLRGLSLAQSSTESNPRFFEQAARSSNLTGVMQEKVHPKQEPFRGSGATSSDKDRSAPAN